MYIRVKRINNGVYAYLSECKWSKRNKKPIQRCKKYLGRVFYFENNKRDFVYNLRLDKISFINEIIENELFGCGFKLERGIYINEDITVDLANKNVRFKERDAVIGLNNGFLCKESLERLYNFKEINNMDIMDAGRKLGKRLIDCGISVGGELFVELFRKIYKNI